MLHPPAWRRILCATVLGLCWLGAVAAAPRNGSEATSATKAGARTSSTPNIILILTDDQRFDTLWSMPEVQKRLVDHGVNFKQAFVVNSLCCPSRSSILTGLYSHNTGVYRNDPPFAADAFDPSSTIATWLDPTYETGLFGKYLNGYEGAAIPPGWDSWTVFNQGSNGVAYYNYTINENGQINAYGSRPQDYSTDVLASRAEAFVQNATSPFFLYFAPIGPHAPAIPAPGDRLLFSHLAPYRPPSYNEADISDKPAWVKARQPHTWSRAHKTHTDEFSQDQYQTLRSVDRAVGGILDAVKARGELGNTMIVFMSDNGYMLGEHRITAKAAPYEESIRVPMVIRYDPLTASAGRQIDDSHMVLNIDLAPTFAAAAGVTPGLTPDGTSLLPLLDQSASSWRSDFLVEHLDEKGLPTYCAVRSETEKYVWYSTGEQELYDLSIDPYEMKNRANSPAYAGDVTTMRARMQQLCEPPPPDASFVLPPVSARLAP